MAVDQYNQSVIEVVRNRLTESQSALVTDRDIHRFCCARNFVPDDVYAMTLGYLKWKEEKKPDSITHLHPAVIKEASTCKAYFLGFTKKRMPLVLVHGGGHDPQWSSVPETITYVLYMLKVAVSHMPEGITQVCLISDYSSFSVFNNMDNELIKEAAHMLQSYYPENIGDVYLTNYSVIMSGIWSIASRWVDEKTRSKFHFVSDLQEILDLADPSIIPTFLGGNLEDHMPTDGNSGIERLEQKRGLVQ